MHSSQVLCSRLAANTPQQTNLDHQKTLLKQETKTLLDAVNEHFTSNPTSQAEILHVSSVSANSKALSEALKSLSSPKTNKEHKDKSVYFLLAESVPSTSEPGAGAEDKETGGGGGAGAGASGGKVVHGCFVPDTMQKKGMDANKWASEVAEVVGGKAGGKGATCLGQGTKVDSVDEAVERARKWFEGLGI